MYNVQCYNKISYFLYLIVCVDWTVSFAYILKFDFYKFLYPLDGIHQSYFRVADFVGVVMSSCFI